MAPSVSVCRTAIRALPHANAAKSKNMTHGSLMLMNLCPKKLNIQKFKQAAPPLLRQLP
jgi:hypothetical protein